MDNTENNEEEELIKAFQARLAKAEQSRTRVLTKAQRAVRDRNMFPTYYQDNKIRSYRENDRLNLATGLSDDISLYYGKGQFC